MRSNIANPHTRTITIQNVSKHVFAYRYGSRFEGEAVDDDKKTSNSTANFNMSTIEKAVEIFGSSYISRFLSAGDISIITPWCSLAADISLVFNVDDTRRRANFEQGKLVLPICGRDNF
jgi:hypothetical protein